MSSSLKTADTALPLAQLLGERLEVRTPFAPTCDNGSSLRKRSRVKRQAQSRCLASKCGINKRTGKSAELLLPPIPPTLHLTTLHDITRHSHDIPTTLHHKPPCIGAFGGSPKDGLLPAGALNQLRNKTKGDASRLRPLELL